MNECLNSIQKEFCLDVVHKIKDCPISYHFLERVDENDAPEYYKVIKHPMWLNEVERKINNNEYKTTDQWRSDVELIWKNAKTFNKQSGNYIFIAAIELQKVFEEMVVSIPSTPYEKWIKDIEREQKQLSKILRSMPGYYYPDREKEKEKSKENLARSGSKSKI